MQLTAYTLKTCDTCRKALKALEAAGHDVTNIDVRTEGVPPGALAAWVAALGADTLVNTRSTTWRGLSEAERARARGDAAGLLAEHPTLMKRPVILAGDDIFVGWTPAVRGALGA